MSLYCETYTQVKDPSDTTSYGFDYTTLGWLASGDTLDTSSWSSDAGITLVSDTFTDTQANVLISGGTSGVDYVVTNTITTDNGLTKQTSFTLRVRER